MKLKMETAVASKVNGTVQEVYVKNGDSVTEDTLLVTFALDPEDQKEIVHPELPDMDLDSLSDDELKVINVNYGDR